jgi:hypothetical protein
MFVHSLWYLFSDEHAGLSAQVERVLGTSASRAELPNGTLVTRPELVPSSIDPSPWAEPPDPTPGLVGVYVLDGEVVTSRALGGQVVGVVSPFPALNRYTLEELSAGTDGRPLLPDLAWSNLLSIARSDLFELRVANSDQEVAVTYLAGQPEGGPGWPFEHHEQFTAATVRWNHRLITVFADGQIWLDDIPPVDVPAAISNVVSQLWT